MRRPTTVNCGLRLPSKRCTWYLTVVSSKPRMPSICLIAAGVKCHHDSRGCTRSKFGRNAMFGFSRLAAICGSE